MKPRIGHYEIAQELGRGGMGVVYKGFEAALNRFVAIKTLSESLAHDASIVERFMREARSMAALNDPHIIQIYFVGEDQGQPFFAMEFVEGESLSQKLKREGRLPASVACQILLQTAQGLMTAHDRGVIHRDIKPANLMITQRGLVKVADFGIALATHDLSKKLTSTGEFVGTPGYLSPEVCMGKSIDARSDIFSLGIVFFEMLTGRIPFNDASPLGLMLEVVQAAVPDVRTLNAEVDANVHAILTRMVAKEPEHRYQSCHDLIEDLVAIGTSTVGGLSARPLSAQILIPPAQTGVPSARVSAVSGIGAAAGMPPPVAPVSAGGARLQSGVQPQAVAPRVSGVHTQAMSPQTPAPPLPYPAPAARKRSGAPWIIAASLMLGGAGFAGWHYREQLGLVNKPVTVAVNGNPAPVQTPTQLQPSTPTPAPNANPPVSTPDPASNPTQVATSADPANPANPPAQGTSWFSKSEAEAPTVAEAPPTTPTTAQGDLEAELAAARAEAEAARVAMEKMRAEAAEAPQVASAPPLTGPGPRNGLGPRGNLERISERVAARANAPAEAPPVAAGPSGRVLVVAFGHDGAASIAQQSLSSGLSKAGYTVIDADLVGGMAQLVGGDRDPNFPALARIAAANGVDVIVAARVQILGTQELTFYGQSNTQFNTMLHVRAFAVASRTQIDSWEEQLDFTSLNLLDNTRAAVRPAVNALSKQLSPYRARG